MKILFLTAAASSCLCHARTTPVGFVPSFASKRHVASASSSSFVASPITASGSSISSRYQIHQLNAKKKKKVASSDSNVATKDAENDIAAAAAVADRADADAINASLSDADISETAEPSTTEEEKVDDEELKYDKEMMQQAIQMATSSGGERGSHGPFPRPICGAVLVAKDGRILGKGRSNYEGHAVEFAFEDAGISATPLREWCVAWPSNTQFRKDISESTLYVTLEPSNERQGEEKPPITQLIEMANIPRLVIGCQDPIAENAAKGAGTLHAAGVSVTMGVLQEDSMRLIEGYEKLANTKLQRMARQHMKNFGRPMGHLHCSVIDSDDADAFARNGNSFGKNFGGQHLSYRDFGTFEIAPPPESVWASDTTDEVDESSSSEVDDFFAMDFEDEDAQDILGDNPMMAGYEQVDACVATFPRAGRGPVNDPSIQARLKGLQWLATGGNSLPAGVERILVLDATDLKDLPLTNDDPNLPPGVDVEAFWKADGRKPCRVLLRHGDNAVAIAVAQAAAKATAAAAKASEMARQAIETGDAELAAEAALECQQAAMASNAFIQKEIQKTQDLKQRLSKLGVKVEIIKGAKPIDVMEHLGKRSGYSSVVWRAGCWGNRGVQAILTGAFQRVSAHLAVDAVGGKFWQLMLAERALQSACGPEREIKVFAEQDDINLEYCDSEGADKDCALLFDGRPVRHVRLDAQVAVIDEIKRKEQTLAKTVTLKTFHEEEAPWFL